MAAAGAKKPKRLGLFRQERDRAPEHRLFKRENHHKARSVRSAATLPTAGRGPVNKVCAGHEVRVGHAARTC